MNVQRLFESINRYELIHGFKPGGVTMLASDMATLQDEMAANGSVLAADPPVARKIPKAGPGETYAMTFMGVPLFTKTSGIEPDRLTMWVSAKDEPRAVQSLKKQIRKSRRS